ncbi:MAG: hypothetical protein RLY59_677 [Actinomycetota bacterium]
MTTPDHTDVYFTAEFIDGPLAGTAEERVPSTVLSQSSVTSR